jgi:hypothetical protein
MLGLLAAVATATAGGCATCPAPLAPPDTTIPQPPVDYRRLCEYFPPLPDGLVQSRSSVFDVCVDPRGRVSQVDVKKSCGDRKIDLFLARAVLLWIYEPRQERGSATPFCHPIAIRYQRIDPGQSSKP